MKRHMIQSAAAITYKCLPSKSISSTFLKLQNMQFFFVSLCLFCLFYSVMAAEETFEGVATVMQFRPLKNISLTKRGHGNGTWYCVDIDLLLHTQRITNSSLLQV